MISRKTGAAILLGAAVLVAVIALMAPRFAQPLSYHQFADQRSWLGIPRFGDVVSNVAFVVIGACGLFVLTREHARAYFIDARERWPYLIVFAGMLLVAAGSAYYHLAPDNNRLVWDRLPMTIVFMALVDAMFVERLSIKFGLLLLPVLLLAGIASVLEWRLSELHGAGDLRLYAAVQVYAVLALLLILLLPARYTRSNDLLIVVAFYVVAKLLESADRPIFSLGHTVSGHTLKHLAAAAAGYWILRMLQRRKPPGGNSLNPRQGVEPSTPTSQRVKTLGFSP